MQTEFGTDERELMSSLQEFLGGMRQPDQRMIDGRLLDRQAVLAPMKELGAVGWLGLADARTADAQPFSVIVGLAETTSNRHLPLAFPLVDTWFVIQTLSRRSLEPHLTSVLDQLVAGELLSGFSADIGAAEGGLVAERVAFGDSCDVIVAGDVQGTAPLTVHLGHDLVSTSPIPELDLSAPAARIELGGGRPLPGPGSMTDFDIARYRCLQAAQLVGQAQALFDTTVAYVKERKQFGVPVGSFQAIKHRLADLYCELETARSILYYAAWVTEMDQPRSKSLAAMAKAFAGECAFTMAGEAVQLHGGMGFTWECGLHYGARRIAALNMSCGSPAECYRHVGEDIITNGSQWEI